LHIRAFAVANATRKFRPRRPRPDQGPDEGIQYRSVIFFHNAEQERLAKASKEKLQESGKYRRPIVTEIAPASDFWKAEEYHQQYYEKCGIVPMRTVRKL
jgi:peptide-methionine (S)-S-oxide reductase